MTLVGVDGCPSGWGAAVSDERLAEVRFRACASFADVVRGLDGRTAMVAVDMPAGLPSAGARACDLAARERLGPARASSVFPAPCRPALSAGSYEEACALSRAAGGKALSRQCYGILSKVREVDEWLTPERQQWVREAHPELVFAMLSPEGRGLGCSKKNRAGEEARLALLPGILGLLRPADVVAALRPARVARDDVVDALACLAAAHRLHAGAAVVLPEKPELDARGLRMEIVA